MRKRLLHETYDTNASQPVGVTTIMSLFEELQAHTQSLERNRPVELIAAFSLGSFSLVAALGAWRIVGGLGRYRSSGGAFEPHEFERSPLQSAESADRDTASRRLLGGEVGLELSEMEDF